jgi:hypothetical protein
MICARTDGPNGVVWLLRKEHSSLAQALAKKGVPMSDRTMDRRQMLRNAGVAAGGVAVTSLAFASPAQASDDKQGGTLTGSWLITRQDTGDPTKVKGVLSFASGGVLVEHDINPAGPPFTGTWAAREDHGFRGTIWSGFPGDGPGAPGISVRVRLVGSVKHGTLSATYTVAVFDPTGAKVDSATGSLSGQRITA